MVSKNGGDITPHDKNYLLYRLKRHGKKIVYGDENSPENRFVHQLSQDMKQHGVQGCAHGILGAYLNNKEVLSDKKYNDFKDYLIKKSDWKDLPYDFSALCEMAEWFDASELESDFITTHIGLYAFFQNSTQKPGQVSLSHFRLKGTHLKNFLLIKEYSSHPSNKDGFDYTGLFFRSKKGHYITIMRERLSKRPRFLIATNEATTEDGFQMITIKTTVHSQKYHRSNAVMKKISSPDDFKPGFYDEKGLKKIGIGDDVIEIMKNQDALVEYASLKD